jgi:hypothetical protein
MNFIFPYILKHNFFILYFEEEKKIIILHYYHAFSLNAVFEVNKHVENTLFLKA